ncbi:hypothetical protein BTA51_23765 [Hahella sp. CCB-MM4]|uniref:PilN domain-containing protein n=1 Tax=Hahella sp. (strain CCB-MM4) TaxID=1926491 RepID=UPI000B9B77A0|nr:hypothetical protein [Hahella sp. CCB-MM4]OZG70858.1 hypothetical protein BTA51_23765 [Hahella sp. CCB-MM4]
MQQVNLYTQEFRPRKDPLAFKNMLMVLGVILVIGGIYSAYLFWDVHQQKQQAALLDQGNVQLQQEVDALQKRLEVRARDTQLQSENDVLKARLKNTQQLLDIIDEGVNDEDEQGVFGEILTALAKHRLEPMWLNRIAILQAGERLILSGQTQEPDVIPQYLKALGTEPVLSGRAFNVFQIEKPEGTRDDTRIFKVDTLTSPEGSSQNSGADNDGLSSNVSTLIDRGTS